MDAVLKPARYGAEEIAYRTIYALNYLGSRLKNVPVRTLLVNGSPKTGTAWMVSMLASIPNYRIGANFHGRIERYLTMSTGDIAHGHDSWKPELQANLTSKDIRVVLMYRDPRDQAVSRMYHIRRETKHMWHSRFLEMDNDQALMACIEGRPDERLPGMADMINLTKSWDNPESGAIFVRYEDLARDTTGRLEEVLKHFDIFIPHLLLKSIIMRNRFERRTVGRNILQKSRRQGETDSTSHYRKGVSGDWKNHFKPDHIRRTKELAGETLIEWAYESSDQW